MLQAHCEFTNVGYLFFFIPSLDLKIKNQKKPSLHWTPEVIPGLYLIDIIKKEVLDKAAIKWFFPSNNHP